MAEGKGQKAEISYREEEIGFRYCINVRLLNILYLFLNS